MVSASSETKFADATETADVGVEARVKWFDPKRGFGFCTCAPSPGAQGPVSTSARGANSSAVDVFFGSDEASSARARGLSLARGELVICDIDATGAKPEARSLRPPATRRAGDAPTNNGSAEAYATDICTSSEAGTALHAMAAQVKCTVSPALCDTDTFATAAKDLEDLLRTAWEQHASAGRQNLEAFVQGACFEALQAFARHTLVSPKLSSSSSEDGAARLAKEWLGRLAHGPWCWSPQQRRALEEWRTLAEEIHGDKGIQSGVDVTSQGAASFGSRGAGECDSNAGVRSPQTRKRRSVEMAEPDPTQHGADRIDAVLEQRTHRFVVVLEGVRNSANQQMICRTCEALGVHEVWLLPPPEGVKYKAAGVRSKHASRGCERFLSLRRFASAAEVVAICRAEGRELWATHCPSASAFGDGAGTTNPPTRVVPCVPLVAGSVPEPLPRLALVLGTEGEGVSPAMLDLASRWVYLPMHGFVQSLNVAVACGMLLQRLFDLCHEARGDLPSSTRNQFRATVLRTNPRLNAAAECDAEFDSHTEVGPIADGIAALEAD